MNNTDNNNTNNEDNLLPLLIVPGLMSSAMEIQKSSIDDRYVGDRVWMDPLAVARGRLNPGDEKVTAKSTVAEEEYKLLRPPEENAQEDEQDDDLETHSVYDEELHFESPWLQHISMTKDMITEREGNEIRPIQGLDGIDFLAEIANRNIPFTYVFGPIIEKLQEVGYIKGKNLDALPYDWRLPPSILEERDGFFSQSLERIERMKTETGKPVVLLGHSMGTKTVHYLLNFALSKKGRAWIDEHVHTFVPVGGVHIGSAEVIGSIFSGKLDPQLDPFLDLQESLVFARQLGSGVWVMNRTLPSLQRNAPPVVMCKPEGILTVQIVDPLGDLNELVNNDYGTRPIDPFKVQVLYGDWGGQTNNVAEQSSRVAQKVAGPNGEDNKDAHYYDIGNTKFVFPTSTVLVDNDEKSTFKPIRIVLRERGEIRASRKEAYPANLQNLQRLDRTYQDAFSWNTLQAAREKYHTNLAMSMPIVLDATQTSELVDAGPKGITLTVRIIARVDMTLRGMEPKDTYRSIDAKVKIVWAPPPTTLLDDPTDPIAAVPEPSDTESLFAPVPRITGSGTGTADDKSFPYLPLSGQTILRAEGLEDFQLRLAKDIYNQDPLGPRTLSSSERPPVQRIYAVYGVNVNTIVSTICKRVPAYHEDDTLLEQLSRPNFELDTEAVLDSTATGESGGGGHTLKDGFLYETPETPQVDLRTGDRIKRSGDGSIPYYCLQQPQVWANELKAAAAAAVAAAEDAITTDATTTTEDRVDIVEIENAQHRAILNDDRFHDLLIDYLKSGKPTSESFVTKKQ